MYDALAMDRTRTDEDDFDSLPLEPAPVSASLRLLTQVLEGLCWLGAAFTLAIHVALVFDLWPGLLSGAGGGPAGLISSSITVGEPGVDEVAAGFLRDPVFLVSLAVSGALVIWALLGARRALAGVGRGAFFARGTLLGLRDMAVAVLLNLVAPPLIALVARILFVSRHEHGSLSVSLGLSTHTLLMLVFSGAVVVICSVMAHAAKLAEENRQFV
jgi:hypothetical protein